MRKTAAGHARGEAWSAGGRCSGIGRRARGGRRQRTARGGPAHALNLYNPFSGYPLTSGWQDHINRGSLGGIDYAMGVGTALRPRTPGPSPTSRTTGPAATR
ncbi:hypothetical protein ACFQ60_30270 [Streptomyces zhihengii]